MGKKEDIEFANLQEFRIHSLQQKLSKIILLPEKEKVISAWTGMKCTIVPTYRGFDEHPGQLYLTNKRLIWIQDEMFSFDSSL